MPHVELSLTDDASRLAPRTPLVPVRSVRPSQPSQPAGPAHRAEAAEPAEAAHRAEPAEAAEAAESSGPAAPPTPPPASTSGVERWAATVVGATEPSLVLSADAVIIAASASCATLIGLGDPAAAQGQPLRKAVASLVDFTDSHAELDSSETDKIPPLLAISSGQLARGLMRVVCPESGNVHTMDAIAAPLREATRVVGSLTFFSKI